MSVQNQIRVFDMACQIYEMERYLWECLWQPSDNHRTREEYSEHMRGSISILRKSLRDLVQALGSDIIGGTQSELDRSLRGTELNVGSYFRGEDSSASIFTFQEMAALLVEPEWGDAEYRSYAEAIQQVVDGLLNPAFEQLCALEVQLPRDLQPLFRLARLTFTIPSRIHTWQCSDSERAERTVLNVDREIESVLEDCIGLPQGLDGVMIGFLDSVNVGVCLRQLRMRVMLRLRDIAEASETRTVSSAGEQTHGSDVALLRADAQSSSLDASTPGLAIAHPPAIVTASGVLNPTSDSAARQIDGRQPQPGASSVDRQIESDTDNIPEAEELPPPPAAANPPSPPAQTTDVNGDAANPPSPTAHTPDVNGDAANPPGPPAHTTDEDGERAGMDRDVSFRETSRGINLNGIEVRLSPRPKQFLLELCQTEHPMTYEAICIKLALSTRTGNTNARRQMCDIKKALRNSFNGDVLTSEPYGNGKKTRLYSLDFNAIKRPR